MTRANYAKLAPELFKRYLETLHIFVSRTPHDFVTPNAGANRQA